ncbi:MAG: PIN domain protein [Verrucomicrobiota bacterium]
MHALTLYLDTSVIGCYFDDEWKEPTEALWRLMEQGKYRFVTSSITLDEIQNAPENVRELFVNTFPAESLIDMDEEMESLAGLYVSQSVLTPKFTDDARHVAVCTVSRIDYLVSWNFKHLVNLDREKGFNAVNLLQNYPTIRMINPLELVYGNDEN